MNEKNVNCEVSMVSKVSKKSGNEYEVLVIKFENGYEKTVFLENSEIYMLHGMVD